jgi:FkbM family methyltransferase
MTVGGSLRRFVPPGIRAALWYVLKGRRDPGMSRQLARLRETIWTRPNALVRFAGYEIRIAEGSSFYHQCRYVFADRAYHFEAQREDPLIIDGGSNIGISILYFKRAYPKSRIIGFEPDPASFRILEENVTRNRLRDVTIVNAGLGAEEGVRSFVQEGSESSRFREGPGSFPVRAERLSDCVSEPVDLLKLNIEGDELPVLLDAEASGALRNVREIVVEYHDWATSEQQLATLLDLLRRQGFRYRTRDWDGPLSRPAGVGCEWGPWSCLVCARRIDAPFSPDGR